MLLTLRLVLFDSETVLSQASSSQAFSIQKGGEPLGSSQFCLGLSRPEASQTGFLLHCPYGLS